MLESAIPAIERLESLIAATNTAQMSALHNVFPKLEHLEKVLATDRAEQNRNLNKFEADESLKRLEKLSEEQRVEFDALDLVGQLRLESGRALWGWEEVSFWRAGLANGPKAKSRCWRPFPEGISSLCRSAISMPLSRLVGDRSNTGMGKRS